MNYYNNNMQSLINIKDKNHPIIYFFIVFTIILLSYLLTIPVYDNYDIYVYSEYQDDKLILNTNASCDNTNNLLEGEFIKYQNNKYIITNSYINTSLIEPSSNLAYNVISIKTNPIIDIKENTVVKVTLLKNKQRLIYKLIDFIK